jgi:hypothetical protein
MFVNGEAGLRAAGALIVFQQTWAGATSAPARAANRQSRASRSHPDGVIEMHQEERPDRGRTGAGT